MNFDFLGHGAFKISVIIVLTLLLLRLAGPIVDQVSRLMLKSRKPTVLPPTDQPAPQDEAAPADATSGSSANGASLPQVCVTPVEAQRLTTFLDIIRHGVRWLIVLVAGTLILAETGINIGPLIAGAGVVGIAVGFGAQSLVKDLFYGFFILAENQFGLGDVIQVGDDKGPSGQVERMTFRTVTLRDLDGRAHIVPNGEITRVTVYSKDWARANVDVTVSYDADLDAVFSVIHQVGEQLYQDWSDHLLEAPTVLGVEGLDDSGVRIKIIAKTKPLLQWPVMREFRKRLKTRLQSEGYTIPFPQRALHLHPEMGPLRVSVETARCLG
jgi:small conductance mechanosensitive channel